jgi:nucleoside-diphosphate-sugar epimerase
LKPENKIVFAVTGANGYLGNLISNYIEDKGYTVYRLVHSFSDSVNKSKKNIQFSLGSNENLSILQKVNVLIHCAYDFNLKRWNEINKVNVIGTKKLFEMAKSCGTKIVYISTMSSFKDCASKYGKAKLTIEKEAFKFNGVVLRPGLVFGKSSGGMFGTLKGIVLKNKLIPIISGVSSRLYLIHEDDLVKSVYSICKKDYWNIKTPIILANKNGKTIEEILTTLCEKIGEKRIFINIPWRIIWFLVLVFEWINRSSRIGADSLKSLIYQEKNPSFTKSEELGLHFKDFNINHL